MKIPVSECPAGKEIDVMVAQALGHLVFQEFDRQFIASDVDAFQNGISQGLFWEGKKGESPEYCLLMPQYSRYTADSEPALRALLKMGYVLAWDEDDEWIVGKPEVFTAFGAWDYEADVDEFANGGTIPLAVSRAFLKANSVEEIEYEDTS